MKKDNSPLPIGSFKSTPIMAATRADAAAILAQTYGSARWQLRPIGGKVKMHAGGFKAGWFFMVCPVPLAEIYYRTAPEFRAKLSAIAVLCGKQVLDVFALWREYSLKCQSSDQSALLWEFVQWYQNQLGAALPELMAAVEDRAPVPAGLISDQTWSD